MKLLQLLALASVLLFGSAYADNDDGCRGNPHHCGGDTGPPGADGADGADGVDGQDGQDGQDGADGQDGRDGIDGIDGLNGVNGINGRAGRDGVVDYSFVREFRNLSTRFSRYNAASEALQIYLPQDQNQRVTFGIGQFANQTGYGVGYAYKTDTKSSIAFTLGIAQSGSERVGKASVGFEFGGNSSGRSHRHQYTCNYVGGKLTAEAEDSQECN